MNTDPNAPLEGQDVTILAQSLFSEDTPDSIDASETLSTPDNVVPITPVVPVTPVQAVAPVQPVQPVVPENVVIDQEKMKQFEQWQKLQSAPVQPVQQQQQQVVQQQQQPAPVQMPTQSQLSPKEADRIMNKFTLGQQEYDAIFKTDSEEASIAALNNVLQNTVKQAVTMAFHLVNDTESKVINKVQPYIQFADTQRELMLRESFFSEHPSLKGADPIISAVMSQMAQGGVKYASQKELFDAVATSTKAQLAQMGLVQGQTNNPTPRAASVKRPMASLPTGGQGGSQASADTGQGGSNTARTIFS